MRYINININIFLCAPDELGVNGSRREIAFLSVTHEAIVRNIDEVQRERGNSLISERTEERRRLCMERSDAVGVSERVSCNHAWVRRSYGIIES